MADNKPTSLYYSNLGGINEKSSEYSLETTQFLNIRNLDFNIPNALSKRPGSTQAVIQGTSGPIIGLFEYEKLTGESFVIAGSDTAMFYLASNSFTLLDTQWDNGQPPDMLTFVNKLWMANGEKYKYWDGVTLLNSGVPCAPFLNGAGLSKGGFSQASTWWGQTLTSFTGGPLELYLFYAYSTSIFPSENPQTGGVNASDQVGLLQTYQFNLGIAGTTLPAGVTVTAFTAPVGYAIDADNGINVFAALRSQASVNESPLSLSQFWFIRSASLGTTAITLAYNDFSSWPPDTFQFSGPAFCFYNTFTPKYIEMNQNIMFLSGFSSSPSVFFHSEVGQPENIQPDYSFEVRTNDGDRLTGQKSYGNDLMVFKERSFHKLIGDSPDNFELIQISTEYGCLSNKSIVEYRQKMAWLDRQGIIEYNGTSYGVLSVNIEDTLRRINLSAALEKACGVHDTFRNQIWFGIPIDGSSENNITIVYDYLVKAWAIFDGFNPSSFASIKAAGSKPTVWRGDYSGMIYYHNESLYADNGTAFTCLAFTKFELYAGENATSIWRRLFLDVIPESGATGAINVELFSNYNKSDVQATFTIYQSAFQTRAEFGVPAKSVAARFSHYNASLPLVINGYSWTKRYLRNV